ncbi:hypothetical protein CMI47_20475 [Candidatus Pacearchaeota archaeon]|nr:hypothetical protein [Candidatus Pacearchaeota archaeon]
MGDPTQEPIVDGNNPDLEAAANAAIEANAKAQAETSAPDIETETETAAPEANVETETETETETAAPEANVETVETAAPTNGANGANGAANVATEAPAANVETQAIEEAAKEVEKAAKEVEKKIKRQEALLDRLKSEAHVLEATGVVAGANAFGNSDYARARVARASQKSGGMVNTFTVGFILSMVGVFGLEALASYLGWSDSFFLVRWFSEPMDTFFSTGLMVGTAYCLALAMAMGGVYARQIEKPKDDGPLLRNSAPWAFNAGCAIAGLALAHPVIEVLTYLVG